MRTKEEAHNLISDLNDETGDFELDYLTSQKIDWGFRGQAGPVIIKEL